MTPVELVAAIGSNKTALDALPDYLRNAVLAVKKEKDERDRWMAESEKREDEKYRVQHDNERKELLCIGTWAENIPRNRRFVLCERDWKKPGEYVRGSFFCKREVVPCIELCAVDIVRGYMNPYFGYYCGDGMKQHQLKSWWEERLKPVIEAKTEGKFLACIRCGWDSFEIYPNKAEFPFRILTYEVGADGNIKITGRSEAKTWQEHRDNLKKEFAKGALEAYGENIQKETEI